MNDFPVCFNRDVLLAIYPFWPGPLRSSLDRLVLNRKPLTFRTQVGHTLPLLATFSSEGTSVCLKFVQIVCRAPSAKFLPKFFIKSRYE